MNNPIKHCYSNAMHTKAWNEMRARQAAVSGRGTGNDTAYAKAKKKRTAPFDIKEEAYEKQNKKMRAEHKRDTGKTLGERQTKGTGKRRVSFACRFAGMKGPMKKPNGKPTRKAIALKKSKNFSKKQTRRSKSSYTKLC